MVKEDEKGEGEGDEGNRHIRHTCKYSKAGLLQSVVYGLVCTCANIQQAVKAVDLIIQTNANVFQTVADRSCKPYLVKTALEPAAN